MIKVEPLNFYSNDMTLTKDQLVHNHLKLTYQKNLVNIILRLIEKNLLKSKINITH